MRTKQFGYCFFGVTPKGKQALCPGGRFLCFLPGLLLDSKPFGEKQGIEDQSGTRTIYLARKFPGLSGNSIVQLSGFGTIDTLRKHPTSRIQYPEKLKAPRSKSSPQGGVFDPSGATGPDCKIGWTQFEIWRLELFWILDVGSWMFSQAFRAASSAGRKSRRSMRTANRQRLVLHPLMR